MSVFRRILPLLAVAVTIACTSPSTGAIEDLSGNVPATITSSPPSAGADGSAGAGPDGQDGQNGQSGQDGRDGPDGRGSTDGRGTGTTPTSSGGPDRGSLTVTKNDVVIGPAFAGEQTVSFGSTRSGSTTTRSISVMIVGEATVTSVDVDPGTGAFHLVDEGCTGAVFPGPCRVTVTATPPAEGEHVGVLNIRYTTAANRSGNPGVKLTVVGEGAGSGRSGPEEEEEDEEEETAEPERPTETPPTTSG